MFSFSTKYTSNSYSLKLSSNILPSTVTVLPSLSISMPPLFFISFVLLCVLFNIASTLATNILGLNGFDIYSSTPNSNPNN